MGLHERNRRRQVIVALISMTMPLPLQQLKAWEPVHIDRTHASAKLSPTTQGTASPAPAIVAPTTALGATPAPTATTVPAGIKSSTPATHFSATPTANAGQTTKTAPSRFKPVTIVEPGAPRLQPADEFENALNGAWEPVKTASKSGIKPIDPIKIEDPTRAVDPALHADWTGKPIGIPATNSAAPAPGKLAVTSPAPTSPAPTNPAPTSTVPTVPSVAGTTQAPFKPTVIQDHLAAQDRLEMLGGEMLGGNGTTVPTSAIGAASTRLASAAPAPRTPSAPHLPAAVNIPYGEVAPANALLANASLASAGTPKPSLSPAPLASAAPAQAPIAPSSPTSPKVASGFTMPSIPATKPQPGDEPGATSLASASLIQNPPKPRATAPNGQEELPPPVGAGAQANAAQPLAANGVQSVSITRTEALQLALERNPNVRVLAKNPQIVSTGLTTADAFFDPFLKAGVIGSKQDQQLTDTLQNFGGNFTTNQRDALLPLGSINNLSIGQQLRGGGEYEVGVGTIYEHFDRVGAFRLVNPAWLSSVNLHFEQPLFEGRGRAIGESLIEIARINNRQSNEEFRAEVNIILRDAEIAYWTLALLEQQANAYRTIIEKSEQQLTGETDRLDLGDSILPDVLESRDQYTELLTMAATIETARREAAQRLANILGYTPAQAATLRTSESERPVAALPNYEEGVARLMLRPELEAQRSAIRRSEVELRRQINTLQPDLRMVMDYAITGLDEDLAGSMETVVDNDFHYAALGFVLQQPIGRRAEFASVRRANLALCQERERLEALQHQYTHQLQGIYSQLQAQAEVIRLANDRVAIAQEQYTLRLTLRNEGEGDLDSVLRTQQRLSIAQTVANEAVYRYQQLLVQWQYEQGAIGDERIAINP